MTGWCGFGPRQNTAWVGPSGDKAFRASSLLLLPCVFGFEAQPNPPWGGARCTRQQNRRPKSPSAGGKTSQNRRARNRLTTAMATVGEGPSSPLHQTNDPRSPDKSFAVASCAPWFVPPATTFPDENTGYADALRIQQSEIVIYLEGRLLIPPAIADASMFPRCLRESLALAMTAGVSLRRYVAATYRLKRCMACIRNPRAAGIPYTAPT